jgi:phosphoglycerol transferase MdoB-like AlkP superfamily enzyme
MSTEEERRKEAVHNIKRRRALVTHFVSFCVVNILIVVIWLATGGGYFWPGWVILGTGIALVLDVVNVARRTSGEISEEQIRREMDKQAAA